MKTSTFAKIFSALMVVILLSPACQTTDRKEDVTAHQDKALKDFDSTISQKNKGKIICEEVVTFFDQEQIYEPGDAIFLMVTNVSSSQVSEKALLDLRNLGYQFQGSLQIQSQYSLDSCPVSIVRSAQDNEQQFAENSNSTFIIKDLGTIFSWSVQEAHYDQNYWRSEQAMLKSIQSNCQKKTWQIILKNCRTTAQMSRSEFATLLSKNLQDQLKVLFNRNAAFVEMNF